MSSHTVGEGGREGDTHAHVPHVCSCHLCTHPYVHIPHMCTLTFAHPAHTHTPSHVYTPHMYTHTFTYVCTPLTCAHPFTCGWVINLKFEVTLKERDRSHLAQVREPGTRLGETLHKVLPHTTQLRSTPRALWPPPPPGTLLLKARLPSALQASGPILAREPRGSRTDTCLVTGGPLPSTSLALKG